MGGPQHVAIGVGALGVEHLDGERQLRKRDALAREPIPHEYGEGEPHVSDAVARACRGETDAP